MNVERGWGSNESSFTGSQLLISTPLGPEYSPLPHTDKHKVFSFTVTWAGLGNQSLSGTEELGPFLRVSRVWLTCSWRGWKGRQMGCTPARDCTLLLTPQEVLRTRCGQSSTPGPVRKQRYRRPDLTPGALFSKSKGHDHSQKPEVHLTWTTPLPPHCSTPASC